MVDLVMRSWRSPSLPEQKEPARVACEGLVRRVRSSWTYHCNGAEKSYKRSEDKVEAERMQ